MNIPLLPGGKRTVAALAFALMCLWALMHFKGAPGPVPIPASPAAETPAPVAVKMKRSARKLITTAPGGPAKVRVSPLRDKGEALGGTAPDRVDKH